MNTQQPEILKQEKFRYGYRQFVDHNQTGQPIYTYRPLTQDDFLNPTLDDTFVHGLQHNNDVAHLFTTLQAHVQHNPYQHVWRSLKLHWGIAGLAEPMPDLMVAEHVANPERARTVFDVVKEGTRPVCIIEIVSPLFVEADLTHKVAVYEQARIQEYIIIDSGLREGTDTLNYCIQGYRLSGDRYETISANAEGRIQSKTLRVLFGGNAAKDGVDILTDSASTTTTPVTPLASAVQARVDLVQGERRAKDIAAALDFLQA
ncbi:MAG: Uma2 family endonuclease [Chloroflexota bacterium]